MAIKVPGKRFGRRLEHSKVFGHGHHGKKSVIADLLITPLVDMFVIIVLFLIANFSATGEVLMMTKDVQLPEAAHVKEIELAPVVMISNEFVSINGKIIGRVDELARDEFLNIPPLEEELRTMKKQYEDLHALAKDAEGAFKGDVNIQGNRDVNYRILKRVMYSCQSSGYMNLNFAVLQISDGSVPGSAPAAPAAAGASGAP